MTSNITIPAGNGNPSVAEVESKESKRVTSDSVAEFRLAHGHNRLRECSPALLENGYCPVPLGTSKFPATQNGSLQQHDVEYLQRTGKCFEAVHQVGLPKFKAFTGWQRITAASFTDREDPMFHAVDAAMRAPVSGVGVMLGHNGLIGIDLDGGGDLARQIVEEELALLDGVIVRKKGQKGFTQFVRAAPSDAAALQSRALNDAGGDRILDILGAGRQSVLPPSVHPSGVTYEWLTPDDTLLDTDLESLPLVTCEWVDSLIAKLRKAFPGAEVVVGDGGGYVAARAAETSQAIHQGEKWIHDLGIYGLEAKRGGGWCGVAHWRASGTRQPLERRKKNLHIDQNGIKDFGTGERYRPFRLVAAALGLGDDAAKAWLAERVEICDREQPESRVERLIVDQLRHSHERGWLVDLGADEDLVGRWERKEVGSAEAIMQLRGVDRESAVAWLLEQFPPVRDMPACSVRIGTTWILDIPAGGFGSPSLRRYVEIPESSKRILEERQAAVPAPVNVPLHDRSIGCTIEAAGQANDEAMRRFALQGVAAHKKWVTDVETMVKEAKVIHGGITLIQGEVADLIAETDRLRAERNKNAKRHQDLKRAFTQETVLGRGTTYATSRMEYIGTDDDDRKIAEAESDVMSAEAAVSSKLTELAAKTAKLREDRAKLEDLWTEYSKLGDERSIYLLPAWPGTGKTRAFGQHLLATTDFNTLYTAPIIKLVAEVVANNPRKIVARYGQTATNPTTGEPVCKRLDEVQRYVDAGGSPQWMCSGCPFAKEDSEGGQCAFQRGVAGAMGHHAVATSHAMLGGKAPFDLGGEKITKFGEDGKFHRASWDAIIIDEDIERSLSAETLWLPVKGFTKLLIEGASKKVVASRKPAAILADALAGQMDGKVGTHPIDLERLGEHLTREDLAALRDGLRVRRDRLESQAERIFKDGGDGAANKREIEQVSALIEIVGLLWGRVGGRDTAFGYVLLRREREKAQVKVTLNRPKPIDGSWFLWNLDRERKPPALLLLNAFPLPDDVIKRRFAINMPAFPGRNRFKSFGKIVRMVDATPARAPDVHVTYEPSAPTSANKLNVAGAFATPEDDSGDGSRNRRDIWNRIRTAALQGGVVLVVGTNAICEWIRSWAASCGLLADEIRDGEKAGPGIHVLGYGSAVGQNAYEQCDYQFLIGDGRRPPLEEAMWLASVNGGAWPGLQGEKRTVVFDDMELETYVPAHPVDRELLDADTASRMGQAIERIRTAIPAGKRQEVIVMSKAVSAILPDAVADFDAVCSAQRAEVILAGGLSRNMGIMDVLHGVGEVSEWEAREVLEATGHLPEESLRSLSYSYLGIPQEGVPLLTRLPGGKWSTVYLAASDAVEVAKAKLLTAGYEIKGDVHPMPAATEAVALSWREHMVANPNMTERQAKSAVANLKASIPDGMQVVTVAWVAGGKSSRYLVPVTMTPEAATMSIEQATGRRVKAITTPE